MKLCWIPALTAAAIGVSWPCMASPVGAAAAPLFEINREESDRFPDPRVCPALKNYLNANCTASKCVLRSPKRARRDVRIIPAPWVELPIERAQVAAAAIFRNVIRNQKDREPIQPEQAREWIASGRVRLFHLQVMPKRELDPSDPTTKRCPLRDLVMQVNYWRGKDASSLVVEDPRLARAGDWRYSAMVFAMEPTLAQTQACGESSSAELLYVSANWRASLLVGSTVFAVKGGEAPDPLPGEVNDANTSAHSLKQFVQMRGTDWTTCYFDR